MIQGKVWTRGYSDDYWNDPVSPLFFELLGDQLTQIVNIELNGIMGYSKSGDKTDQLLLLYRSHAYFNLEVLKRKVEYEIPPMLRNNDILNYFEEGAGPYGKETMKKQPFRLTKRVLAEVRVMFYDKNGSITKTSKAYDSWTNNQFRLFIDQFDHRFKILSENNDISGLLQLAAELDKLMIGHFRLVRYGIPVHNIGVNLIAQYLLSRFIGKEEAIQNYLTLLSGLKHKTSLTNDALFKLASTIQSSAELKEKILKIPSDMILTQLSDNPNPDSRRFLSELSIFLKEYGIRGFTREPYYPRWQEAPEHVFNILKSIIQDEQNPAKDDKTNQNDYDVSRQEIADKVKAKPLGWIKWQIFSTVLSFARKYIVFRENQRFNLDHWITMNRKIYLEIGKSLHNLNILDEPRDIFFMRKKEIRKIFENKYANNELVQIKKDVLQRKKVFLENEASTPPKFLHGTLESKDFTCKDATEFQGIPASRGVLSGQVRVLDNIADIWKVCAGDILVVPRTDPGWTPVFRKIGGLITETGGILSHGAVVSREYGIPAVTNIPNACHIFKTGQTVTIDGSKGIVTIK